ncbi:oligosaccharide flippase family protein [Photobacterium leiognathi]|uniref:oligosaccharide flippase family protein n=1 Tax=Photobacterium leiognathi TaxID=553611 RepID=UPI0027327E48|nr:oligosaccharide flippase family protein [Photobacterium leiognathi]
MSNIIKKINFIDIRVLKNFSHLAIANLFIMIIPFIYYPYLIRVLGSEVYGNIVYVQAIYFFLSIVIQFGFSVSATKDVSVNRDDNEYISNIFISIFIIKAILLIIGLVVVAFFINYFNIQGVELDLHLTSLLYVFGDLFLVNWIYQGFEKMQYVSLGTIAYKLVFLISIFFFIKSSEDIINYSFLFSLSYVLGNLFLFIFAIYLFKLKLIKPNYQLCKSLFKDSWQFFLARMSAVFVERFNLFILGYTGNKEEVAYYDLAIKLVGIFQLPFNLFNQAYYPNASRNKDSRQVYKIIKILSIVAFFGIIISYVIAPWFINIYAGKSMEPSVLIYYILMFTVLINVPSHFIGNCLLVVNNYSKEFKISITRCTLLYIPLVMIGYYCNVLDSYLLATLYLIYVLSISIYRCLFWLQVKDR